MAPDADGVRAERLTHTEVLLFGIADLMYFTCKNVPRIVTSHGLFAPDIVQIFVIGNSLTLIQRYVYVMTRVNCCYDGHYFVRLRLIYQSFSPSKIDTTKLN